MSKITIDRAVVEQALEALNPTASGNWTPTIALNAESAIHALRAALEQPVEQEPIAWANINKQGDITHTSNKKMAWAKTPLYTHPQPPRQPLTDDEIEKLFPYTHEWLYEIGLEEATKFARSIEAAHGITGEQE